MKNLLHLRPYLLRYRRNIVFGVICIIVTNIFAVLAPRFIGAAVDVMSGSFTIADVLQNIGLYVLFAALSGFFLFLVRQNIIVASRKIEYDLKNDYYAHLQILSKSFYTATSTGELISRGTNDLNAVRDFLGPGIMYSINTFFRLFFALVAMVLISPQLTLLALIPAPFLSYSVYRIGKSMQQKTRSIQESYADITNLVQENISGIRVVKTYTREALETERFRKLNNTYYGKNLSLAKLQAMFFAFLTALLALSLIPVIWVGGINVINGTMTIGDIAQFVIYVSMLSWPIISIGWVTNIIQKAASAQTRLNEIFSTRPDIADGPDSSISDRPVQGRLAFHQVSFHYPGNRENPVLDKISFDIEPSSTVAIVGATGSGKSTLVNLIPRLQDPVEGSITIDGQDIRTMPLAELRRMIGFVPQNNFLFSDTIASNIDYGSTESNTDAVIEASRIANLYDDISDFPEGFDTMLGEKGINLSGGQKQRTCIARALAWKPKLLILDDALSAVDTSTEASIFKSLLDKLPDTTLILISHRISTVKNCDRIMVLKDGRIAESGSHDELLARESIYAELYNQQLLEDEISSLG
ncbi:ABC transporter ATP-binding protein [Prosthecochloris sp. N3]|uniref:ABC transporter ATP-binding protein n=1 Tax=Prosthecochloris ethylica TaxID=2743976 RepID=A0ABR9XTG1_9CHLB|nr:ABC transporter ATP-binding protein [Prosthecochloris ethylica]MBF0585602.1 ABC transporter ATP-binding protein [Prosthecochloris ethylica]MBF0637105.1 ABC transporter ATP-binding protein [Prosthecochloris ethylica]NUK46832.1 ABC transporter ATP-binding protein [Prosthecochloris ethylica]